MSPVVEYVWKASIAILFLHTVLVTGSDQANDDSAVEKRGGSHYSTHMFVGKREPNELESRSPKYGYYFVGKRMPSAFQTRLSPKVGRWFVGKRPYAHRMFVGKRPYAHRMFVGKRPYAHRMFVGKREMELNDAKLVDNAEDWENTAPYDESDLAEGYYGNKPLINPFAYYALEKSKAAENSP